MTPNERRTLLRLAKVLNSTASACQTAAQEIHALLDADRRRVIKLRAPPPPAPLPPRAPPAPLPPRAPPSREALDEWARNLPWRDPAA